MFGAVGLLCERLIIIIRSQVHIEGQSNNHKSLKSLFCSWWGETAPPCSASVLLH